VEALQLGLVDQLGGKDEAEMFMRSNYGLEDVDYIVYQHEAGFFELLTGVVSTFFFNVGEGIGSMLTKPQFGVWM
jgi:ClpP class serine protease